MNSLTIKPKNKKTMKPALTTIALTAAGVLLALVIDHKLKISTMLDKKN